VSGGTDRVINDFCWFVVLYKVGFVSVCTETTNRPRALILSLNATWSKDLGYSIAHTRTYWWEIEVEVGQDLTSHRTHYSL